MSAKNKLALFRKALRSMPGIYRQFLSSEFGGGARAKRDFLTILKDDHEENEVSPLVATMTRGELLLAAS